MFDDFRDTTEAVGYVPIKTPEQRHLVPALIVIGGKAFGQSFTLESELTVIGRGPKSDIHLDDDGVSREHAQIVHAEEEFYTSILIQRTARITMAKPFKFLLYETETNYNWEREPSCGFNIKTWWTKNITAPCMSLKPVIPSPASTIADISWKRLSEK